MAFVSVQVECSDKDLHSGVYGGSVHEAMTDLITLMGKRGFQTVLGDGERVEGGPVARLPSALGIPAFLRAIRVTAASFLLKWALMLRLSLCLPPSSLPHVTNPCVSSRTQLGTPGSMGPCPAQPLESHGPFLWARCVSRASVCCTS